MKVAPKFLAHEAPNNENPTLFPAFTVDQTSTEFYDNVQMKLGGLTIPITLNSPEFSVMDEELWGVLHSSVVMSNSGYSLLGLNQFRVTNLTLVDGLGAPSSPWFFNIRPMAIPPSSDAPYFVRESGDNMAYSELYDVYLGSARSAQATANLSGTLSRLHVVGVSNEFESPNAYDWDFPVGHKWENQNYGSTMNGKVSTGALSSNFVVPSTTPQVTFQDIDQFKRGVARFGFGNLRGDRASSDTVFFLTTDNHLMGVVERLVFTLDERYTDGDSTNETVGFLYTVFDYGHAYTERCVNYMSKAPARALSGALGLYNLTMSGLRSVLEDMWTLDWDEVWRAKFVGSASDAILGVKFFYGIKDEVDAVTTPGADVWVGGVEIEGAPISHFAGRIGNEFVTLDMGDLVVPQTFGDWRDYDFVTYRAYIPYVGFVELDPDDVVGETLSLLYFINLTDGSAVACLSRSNDCAAGGIFTQSIGEMAYDIPIRVNAYKSLEAQTAASSGSIGGIVGGAYMRMGGGQQIGGGIIGDAVGAYMSDKLEGGQSVSYSSGSINSGTGVLMDGQPRLIMYVKQDLMDAEFNTSVGGASTTVRSVNQLSGYFVFDSVQSLGSSVPARHADQIIKMLKSGSYV